MKIIITALFMITLGYQSFAQEGNFNMPEVKGRVSQSEVQPEPTSKDLQATLYELIDQYHAVQQMHWDLQGQDFISVHEMLGEFYKELGGLIDQVAERKLALNYPSDGRPGEVAKMADLKPITNGFVKDYDVIKILSQRYLTISDRLGKRLKSTGETDLVTQDLLIDVRRTMDHHLWKLRSFSY